MPGKNIVKSYASDAYYHLYNRGINKEKIFIDKEDYGVFFNLLKRYLSSKPATDPKGRQYPWLYDQLEVLAFCMMPNHYHLLIFQTEERAMTELIRAISASYGMYFNKKYGRTGPLFQNRFRASLIDNQSYLDHISRYIHLNPGKKVYKSWPASSYQYYLGKKKGEWIRPNRILEMFSSKKQYEEFVADYEDMKDEMDILKHELSHL